MRRRLLAFNEQDDEDLELYLGGGADDAKEQPAGSH